jgi:hypothetical protein
MSVARPGPEPDSSWARHASSVLRRASGSLRRLEPGPAAGVATSGPEVTRLSLRRVESFPCSATSDSEGPAARRALGPGRRRRRRRPLATCLRRLRRVRALTVTESHCQARVRVRLGKHWQARHGRGGAQSEPRPLTEHPMIRRVRAAAESESYDRGTDWQAGPGARTPSQAH